MIGFRPDGQTKVRAMAFGSLSDCALFFCFAWREQGHSCPWYRMLKPPPSGAGIDLLCIERPAAEADSRLTGIQGHECPWSVESHIEKAKMQILRCAQRLTFSSEKLRLSCPEVTRRAMGTPSQNSRKSCFVKPPRCDCKCDCPDKGPCDAWATSSFVR